MNSRIQNLKEIIINMIKEFNNLKEGMNNLNELKEE